MLDKDLEVTLNTVFNEARDRRHEYVTVEHLLLALLDNNSAAQVLKACGANLNVLHGELSKFIQENSPLLTEGDEHDTQPTLGFQRVLQRAVFHVQSSGRKEVKGANVLVAIFGERESHAAFFLSQQEINRLDVVNYIAHGIAKISEDENEHESDSVEEDVVGDDTGLRHWRNMRLTLINKQNKGKLILLLEDNMRLNELSRFCAAEEKIIRYTSVRPALARQLLPKDWPKKL